MWSYNKRYPIAKIVNVSYQQVEDLLGSSSILNFFNKVAPTFEEIQNFTKPLKPAFPEAQVTTCSYKPLIGMVSMTDPRGNTSYYKYDSFRRLKSVLDWQKNVKQDYQYHYRP
ncbi:hypothetical protein [Pararcticibacter amylolyticus]|uniref:hypothetical protein n=1 Tax=Pararcticibacter amylolyticus TaxID=2173175 RepID=UPI0011B214AD|nr:hypothetical protein [Pararcticibacter amylolyticus]